MIFLFLLVVFAFISIPAILPSVVSTAKCRNVAFNNNNKDQWFTCMERRFKENSVSEKNQVSYAIDTGLATAPKQLQEVMTDRSAMYMAVSGKEWVAWNDFKYDISAISSAAVANMKSQDNSFVDGLLAALKLERPDAIDNALQLLYKEFSDFHNLDLKNVGEGITALGQIPFPHLPSREEILRRIKELLEKAQKELEQLYKDGSANAEEVFKKIQRFVKVQIELLPKEVKKAVAEFNKFRKEHPYIVACATVALTILASEVILPWAVLGILRMVGFSELGPVAGSWSALIQSSLYGGRTRGLFSIIQSITMSAKRFWPARVFTGLAAIAAGSVVVWSPESVNEVVEAWRSGDAPLALPDLNSMVTGNGESLYHLERWMIELGNRCADAGIPEGQWLDVAFQFMTREVERLVRESGL